MVLAGDIQMAEGWDPLPPLRRERVEGLPLIGPVGRQAVLTRVIAGDLIAAAIHALRIEHVVLLLQRHAGHLGVGGAVGGAEGRPRCRADRRATTAADRGADTRPQRGAEKTAADG